jgi:hypothetical protein
MFYYFSCSIRPRSEARKGQDLRGHAVIQVPTSFYRFVVVTDVPAAK